MTSMINTWSLYQAEICVIWSRFASFVEVGGRSGLGYRDTAQDAMSVIHSNPEKCKYRICELLNGQVSEGYGIHLFDPALLQKRLGQVPESTLPTVIPTKEADDIIPDFKDVCSDDALWLVATVCEYVKETGDIGFFDEIISYADKVKASVYDHIKSALDFSGKQIGKNGICKGLRADWNDCLNLGGGETSMVSFLHYWALQAFIEAAAFLKREDDVKKYSAMAEKVKNACEKQLWDGEWYLRGFTATGKKIGTHEDEEGKVFLNAQTWAVVSGLSTGEKAIKCMDSVDKYLFSKYGLHLFWPAYSKVDAEIGFVTRVYKGIKENAAIFSHPNPWAIIAETMLGRGDRAFKFYSAILPYNQNDIIEIRRAEPYSYCQFIMGKDHTAFGRANHPWLTGTAGWFYTAATKWILGIRLGFNEIIIDPCIPGNWDRFEVTRIWRNATYNITVLNPNRVQKGVKSITLNGKPVQAPILPQAPGSESIIIVTMG